MYSIHHRRHSLFLRPILGSVVDARYFNNSSLTQYTATYGKEGKHEFAPPFYSADASAAGKNLERGAAVIKCFDNFPRRCRIVLLDALENSFEILSGVRRPADLPQD
jgi:hypothetical protein